MVTPSRQCLENESVQKRRLQLDRAATEIRKFLTVMRPLSRQSGGRSLRKAIPRIEKALEKIESEHAEIDLDLLVACPRSWSHPVQAIGGPRAPFGRVVARCEKRLETARGEERARLQSVHERVTQAHQLLETARRRREERRGGAFEGVRN